MDNTIRKIYDFHEAIDQGFLLPGDSIFLGWIFPEYLPALNIGSGALVGEPHIQQAIDPSLGANNNTEPSYSYFPFGRLTEKKTILTIFNGQYSEWEADIFIYIQENKFGITIEDNVDNSMFITFKKKILVRFSGKYDFPVLMLPEHIAYMV